MAFPTNVPTLNDPTSLDTLASPDHPTLHQDVNTNLEAGLTKIGTGSSTPTTNAVLAGTGSGTSAWATTLAGLTLTAPVVATSLDMNGTELILDADADTSITADTDDQIDVRLSGADDFRFVANTFTALSGSKIVTDRLDELSAMTFYDANGNEYIGFSKTASAVNYFTYANAATGNPPVLTAAGDDTNISFKIATKGTGDFFVNSLNWSGAWASWAPTYTNFSLGDGTLNYAVYTQVGKTVHFRILVTLGSTSAVSGIVGFSLPVTANAQLNALPDTPQTSGQLNDASGQRWQPFVVFGTTGRLDVYYLNGSSNLAAVSSTAPFTWAASDEWTIAGSYEAA